MRKQLRDNGLSLTLGGLFLLCFLGHSLTGYYAYNAEQHAHQHPPVRYGTYLTSGHFWGTVFENWESEFVQMAAYVVLTVFLVQRGSAESKIRIARTRWTRTSAAISTTPTHRDPCGREGSRSRSMPIPSLWP